jgi:hypothetical protein
MKKLMYVLAGVILAVAITSCEKVKENPQGVLVGNDGLLKGQPIAMSSSGESGPVSDAGATPYVIPGENKGGNRTCEEARAAFDIMAGMPGHEFEGLILGEFINCGEKVDIPEGEVGLISGFPFDVWVDDNGAIKFNTGYRDCVVSAVIVKGGNKANVYYYPEGSDHGQGKTYQRRLWDQRRSPPLHCKLVSEFRCKSFCLGKHIQHLSGLHIRYNWHNDRCS